MNAINLILLNFTETRRRSLNLWRGIPKEQLNWKPDEAAFSSLEMIRHVLEGEHLFHQIIKNRGNLGDYQSPWKERPYTDLEDEIAFAETYRAHFVTMIQGLSETDLENIRIERKEVGQDKKLGDYLNRMVYHESVHTGQLLSYLRILGVERPQIWD